MFLCSPWLCMGWSVVTLPGLPPMWTGGWGRVDRVDGRHESPYVAVAFHAAIGLASGIGARYGANITGAITDSGNRMYSCSRFSWASTFGSLDRTTRTKSR
ncbi:unnamed protein product [Dovyalis caffra]|uniref:Secreted protein n=1 Tax=Dovyalis caffra TaxID=77055 RepID=A0AAV1QWR9_9ROSI|nr:unnamed protein product [Dovyalis caffra]